MTATRGELVSPFPHGRGFLELLADGVRCTTTRQADLLKRFKQARWIGVLLGRKRERGNDVRFVLFGKSQHLKPPTRGTMTPSLSHVGRSESTPLVCLRCGNSEWTYLRRDKDYGVVCNECWSVSNPAIRRDSFGRLPDHPDYGTTRNRAEPSDPPSSIAHIPADVQLSGQGEGETVDVTSFQERKP